MVTYAPGSVARISGHPVLRFFASFPIACFAGALATDAVYALTADMIWSDFSAWLLAAGAIMGVLAAIGGFVELLRDPFLRRRGAAWLTALLALITLALAILNNLVHSRDAWTSVVPQGIILSAITCLVMLVTIAAAARASTARFIAEPVAGVR